MDNLTQDQVNEAMNKTYGNREAFYAAVKKYGFGVAVFAALMSNANAASDGSINVSSVVGVITDGVTTVSSIGLAVLSLFVVIKVFKWARSAM